MTVPSRWPKEPSIRIRARGESSSQPIVTSVRLRSGLGLFPMESGVAEVVKMDGRVLGNGGSSTSDYGKGTWNGSERTYVGHVMRFLMA